MMDVFIKKFSLGLFLFFLSAQGGGCLRDVSLEVPAHVKRGESATLLCHYDLQGTTLYSVKWYRGRHEFYRYSPSEKPPSKIFPFPGINVDVSQSNETQVSLRDVGFNLSGNLSCEVTAEGPLNIKNAVVSTHMFVIQVPETEPVLHTDQTRYKAGDELHANCSSSPSRPAATLSFLLNNSPVGNPETRVHPAKDVGLQWSSLSLDMQLYPSHFLNGQLVLKCTALVATVYRGSSEVQLASMGKEPVPERVTSPSKAASCTTVTSLAVWLFLLIQAAR